MGAKHGWRIGLTGGIACGKSTAAQAFETAGFRRIDTDAVVADLLKDDVEVRSALANRWGGAVLRLDGVDKAVIAQRVFADEAELRWLEGLLHPRVGSIWRAALEAEPKARWLVEIPLLFENKLETAFDRTVCVEASEALQLQRLAAKGVTAEQAKARMRRQLPLREKVARADRVLSNYGEPAFLQQQVQWLVSRDFDLTR
ncbi:MAG: dephospho-CoA kinase [Opitutales bacterium]